MTEGRYRAEGMQAEFQPGSRGRVLRNLLGITRVGRARARLRTAGELLQPRAGADFARFRTESLTVPAGLSRKGWKMPSTADELAALTRRRAARRRGSRSQGLLSSKEPFMNRLETTTSTIAHMATDGAMPPQE